MCTSPLKVLSYLLVLQLFCGSHSAMAASQQGRFSQGNTVIGMEYVILNIMTVQFTVDRLGQVKPVERTIATKNNKLTVEIDDRPIFIY